MLNQRSPPALILRRKKVSDAGLSTRLPEYLVATELIERFGVDEEQPYLYKHAIPYLPFTPASSQ